MLAEGRQCGGYDCADLRSTRFSFVVFRSTTLKLLVFWHDFLDRHTNRAARVSKRIFEFFPH
jgi:hypothetical protein